MVQYVASIINDRAFRRIFLLIEKEKVCLKNLTTKFTKENIAFKADQKCKKTHKINNPLFWTFDQLKFGRKIL